MSAGAFGSVVIPRSNTAPATVIRMQTINVDTIPTLVESGDGTAGWLYSWAFGELTTCFAGNPTYYLPGDGWLTMEFVTGAASATGGPAFLLATTDTPGNYLASKVALFRWNTGNLDQYSVWRDGVQVASDNTVNAADGDIGRVRRSGTNMVVEISKDGGGSWLNVVTWTDGYTGDLYGGCNSNAVPGHAMGYFEGSGVVAA